MKKKILFLLAVTLCLSLIACTSKKPSQSEIELALANGTLTYQDALDKKWITEEWMKEHIQANSVPLADKTQSNLLGDFATRTLANKAFSNDDLAPVTFIAFVNPESESGREQFELLASAYEDVLAHGGELLVVTMSEEEIDLYADADFPVVYYNESLQSALGSLVEMVDGNDFVGSWNGNSAFLSAWYMAIDPDTLGETAQSFGDMINSSDEESATMVPMG